MLGLKDNSSLLQLGSHLVVLAMVSIWDNESALAQFFARIEEIVAAENKAGDQTVTRALIVLHSETYPRSLPCQELNGGQAGASS